MEEGEEKKEEEKKPSGPEAELKDKVDKLTSILSGEKPIYLNLQFLIRSDETPKPLLTLPDQERQD